MAQQTQLQNVPELQLADRPSADTTSTVEELKPFVPPWWLRPVVYCVDGFGSLIVSAQQTLCPVKDKLGNTIEAHGATAADMQATQMSRTSSSAMVRESTAQSNGTVNFAAHEGEGQKPIVMLGTPALGSAPTPGGSINGSAKGFVVQGSRNSRASSADESPDKAGSHSTTGPVRRASMNRRTSTSRRDSRTSVDGGGPSATEPGQGPNLLSPTTPGGRNLPPLTPGTSGRKQVQQQSSAKGFKSSRVVPSATADDDTFSSASAGSRTGARTSGGGSPVHVSPGVRPLTGSASSGALPSMVLGHSSSATAVMPRTPVAGGIGPRTPVSGGIGPRTPVSGGIGPRTPVAGGGRFEASEADGKLKMNRRLSATTRKVATASLHAQASSFSLH